MEPVEFAKAYHAAHERLAAQFGVFASGTPYAELPGNVKLLMEAVASQMLDAVRADLRTTECRNVGLPGSGDVIVIRYLDGMPSSADRKKDYTVIRDYFQRSGIQVRILGVSGGMTLDKVDEEQMATFGWFKKR